MERRDHSKNLEMVKTKLFGPSSAAYFTYNRVTWRLNVRKEVSIQHVLTCVHFSSVHVYGILIISYTAPRILTCHFMTEMPSLKVV
jgi:hypothetical protein